jgi:hypothetical protein
MDNWRLHFEHEESVAANDLISLGITVEFEGQKMKDILDIDGLFMMIESEGFIPLFTCSCGSFGCGGYYINVSHNIDGLILNNKYKPVNNPTENDLFEIFQNDLSWEDLYFIASEVYEYISDLVEKHPGYGVCSGTYGENLISKLIQYEELLDILRSRYDE